MHRFSELRYINRFACLGSACPDHCCKDWAVDIDPATERRYRALEPSPLKDELLAALGKRKRQDGRRQTCMTLKPDGLCPMLGSDGLCNIQRNLGEPYLSYTCTTFPRLLTGTTEQGFRSGTIACPEVAREVLWSADAMAEVAPAPDPARPAPPPARPATGPTFSLDEAATVRSLMLRILTSADQPWAGRVTLAVLFAYDLSRLDLVRDRAALTLLVMRIHEVIDRVDLHTVVADDPGAVDLLRRSRIAMLKIIARQRQSSAASPAFIQRSIIGLQRGGTSIDAMSDTLVRLDGERVVPALVAHRQMRGNLLANLLLQRSFPLGRPAELMRQFWEGALAFILWRILLAGQLAHADAGPFEKVAHETTYRTGKMLLHKALVLSELRQALQEHDMVQNPTLLALLR